VEEICQNLRLLLVQKSTGAPIYISLSRLLLLLTGFSRFDAVLLCNLLPCIGSHLTIETDSILLWVLLRVEQTGVFLSQIVEPLEEDVIFVLFEQLQEGA